MFSVIINNANQEGFTITIEEYSIAVMKSLKNIIFFGTF